MRALALLALLAVAACDTAADGPNLDDVDVSELSHDGAALVGTWDLARVSNPGDCAGQCPGTRTAAEAGWSARYVFRADGTAEYRSGHGTARGETVVAGPYAVRYREYDNGTRRDTPLIAFDGRWIVFGIDGDRLYTDDRPVDGELLEFARR